ncbi:MAG TPA: hypothetical protein VGN88_01740 [Phycisphaerae bacterium]|jgi:hypothetical protein
MKNDTTFLSKYNHCVVSRLHCFDRVIFKGYLPGLTYLAGVRQFVDVHLKIRRKDFMAWAKVQSQHIVEHAQTLAQKANRPYLYLQGRQRKEKLVSDLLRESPVAQGLVCVLRCLEHCPSFRLVQGRGRPDFAPTRPPALVFYFYYLDPDLGLIHIRVPTLFPWSIQIAVNGHDYLAQRMIQAKLGFVQKDNVFVELDDPAKAQQLSDDFAGENWPKRLTALTRHVLPVAAKGLDAWDHHWVIDQAEHACDVIFKSRAKLAEVYPRLIDHAALFFKAPDILGFLGRRLHGRFDGEVLTDCKKDRLPGMRIKHRVKNNWIKMYDKQGLVLRVETVINDPKEFKVRRRRIRDGQSVMDWCPMNKGVANLYAYQEQCRAANNRYLAALAAAEEPPQNAGDLHRLGEPCRCGDRFYAGFNPARAGDMSLFAGLCQGAHLLQGFRNQDIRGTLFSTPTTDPREKRRRSAAASRILKRLHVRGLLLKIPHTRRWHLSARGRQLFTELLRAHHNFMRYPAHSLAA